MSHIGMRVGCYDDGECVSELAGLILGSQSGNQPVSSPVSQGCMSDASWYAMLVQVGLGVRNPPERSLGTLAQGSNQVSCLTTGGECSALLPAACRP